MFELFNLWRSGFRHYLSAPMTSNARGKGHNKKAHKNNYKQKIRKNRGKR